MASSLARLPQDLTEIILIHYADFYDYSALAQTSSHFRRTISRALRGQLSRAGLPSAFTVTGSINAMATFLNAQMPPLLTNSNWDSPSGTNTEVTVSPEEQEWKFHVTPDMMRRLSNLPQYQHGSTLPTLPAELQLEIFSHLDKIDSACFGLSSPHTYTIFRAIHGTKMPLNTRRSGPNKLEAAWEVIGASACQHCGMFRCELHQHIKDWMPKELEYCTMKRNFGLPAHSDANATCFRGKPSKPRRCGRHPVRTTTIHQDDVQSKL